jgi:SNF2 family DNA or RNA helicase
MSAHCHYAKKSECLDLPEQLDELRSVELGKIQSKKYNEMKNHLVTEIKGKEIAATVALTKIMKLREITSGFCMDELGESIDIGESSKLNEMDDLAEQTGDKQMIVWAEFQWEIRQLQNRLKDYGAVDALYSETRDREETIANFKNGATRFLIAHPRSAGHGLTFTNCDLEVFFSLGYSYELYEQCRGRIHRFGQKNNCTYIHLLGRGTIDENIYKVVKHKMDAQAMVEEFING